MGLDRRRFRQPPSPLPSPSGTTFVSDNCTTTAAPSRVPFGSVVGLPPEPCPLSPNSYGKGTEGEGDRESQGAMKWGVKLVCLC